MEVSSPVKIKTNTLDVYDLINNLDMVTLKSCSLTESEATIKFEFRGKVYDFDEAFVNHKEQGFVMLKKEILLRLSNN